MSTENIMATSTGMIAVWGFFPVFNLCLVVSTLSLNMPLIFLYITKPHLRTNRFCFYLMNLMTANVVHALLNDPLDFVFALFPTWTHSSTFCTILLYVIFVSDALMVQAHVMITVNRIWAMVFPFSYRTLHSTRVAILMCLSPWVYSHAIILPGLILDGLLYRKAFNNEFCTFNTDLPGQIKWNYVVEIFFFNCPIGIVTFISNWTGPLEYRTSNRSDTFLNRCQRFTCGVVDTRETWIVVNRNGTFHGIREPSRHSFLLQRYFCRWL